MSDADKHGELKKLLDDLDACGAQTQLRAGVWDDIVIWLQDNRDALLTALRPPSAPTSTSIATTCKHSALYTDKGVLRCALCDLEAARSASVPTKLLQDIKYEQQRVMMGARWERAHWTRLLERVDEALATTQRTESAPMKVEFNADEDGLG